MKNNRKIAKEKTLERIIQSTKKLILQKGIVDLTTLEVAKDANVAHGTVFAHFSNRDLLVIEVLQKEILRIARELNKLTNTRLLVLDQFLDSYIDYLSSEERLFEILSKEFPFLNEETQKGIISTETIIRKMIYQKIEEGIIRKQYKQVNITMTLSFLFGTIAYYLSRKEYFVSAEESVLSIKKKEIINTFLSIINK